MIPVNGADLFPSPARSADEETMFRIARWLSQADPPCAEPLSYQEALRTLGVLLARWQVTRAVVAISPEGAMVRTADWPQPRQWTMSELHAAMAEQRSWRSRAEPPASSSDLAMRLRIVGASLDMLPAQSYVLTVQESVIRVLGATGYQRTFDRTSIRHRVLLSVHLRGQQFGPRSLASAGHDAERAHPACTTANGTACPPPG